MSSRNLTLPTEILHDIVSQGIARHLHDFLVETSSSPVSPSDRGADNQMGPPVVAASLLEASCQMRHIALIVLSNALGTALSRVGIWRLEEDPWSTIHAARSFLRRTFDFNADRDVLIKLDGSSGLEEMPPVISVYIYVHLLAEVTTHPFAPLVSPIEGQEPRTVTTDLVARYLEYQAQKQYRLCPPAFQEVVFARMDTVRAECFIARTLVKVMSCISTAWERLEDLAFRVEPVIPPASVAELNEAIQFLIRTLGDVRTCEQWLLRTWPHTNTADATIGAGRLTKWFTTFCDMAEWEYDSEDAQTLREIAQGFADDYHTRFVALHQLERAKEEELAARAAAAERETYTTISDS